ncbi:LysE/ArgO family amino acid transporter [Neobacillus sp. D3-1R]|uniref:LysE/ArgO family amino acid transporter n=1 Tax=Neobacillus sp. D3-1R TaxID=3445778 RepID=UPI003F9F6192
MLNAFIHGFILAFGLILPLGVQNVFVFNQGATQPSFIRAIPVVLTAAICDTILISVAVLGISVIILGLSWIKTILILVGVVFLLVMGFSTWNTKLKKDETESEVFSAKKQILFAASVSLLNPHAILDTIGVIGTSSITYTGSEKWIFTLSCILVSWLWFFGLSLVGKMVGKIDSSGYLIKILNKVSAIIMWGTAAVLILSLL